MNHLSQELDRATSELQDARLSAEESQRECDNALARARLQFGKTPGHKYTVQEKEDEARLLCEQQIRTAGIDKVALLMIKDEIARINQQIDITRSLGTSVRSSMEIA